MQGLGNPSPAKYHPSPFPTIHKISPHTTGINKSCNKIVRHDLLKLFTEHLHISPINHKGNITLGCWPSQTDESKGDVTVKMGLP